MQYPHTWIVWVYAQSVHSHITIQEMSAVRYPFALRKLSDFRLRTAKTLSICLPYSPKRAIQHSKVRNNFRNEQHPMRILHKKRARIFLALFPHITVVLPLLFCLCRAVEATIDIALRQLELILYIFVVADTLLVWTYQAFDLHSLVVVKRFFVLLCPLQ